MGAWGDVILGAEARGIPGGPQKQRANYVTIMLREPYGTGVLGCSLTVYGDTDQELFEYDLVTIKMDSAGLRRLAESAMETAEQIDNYGQGQF